MEVKELNLEIPIIMRFTDTNDDKARKIIEEMRFSATSYMEELVKRAIELSGMIQTSMFQG